MAIGGAFLGGGVEVVPAGRCKLELEILTEDRANLTATFTIKGTSTYTVTAGADGRAVYTVPSGQTYTVSVNTTDYDNISSQTVVAESGTVRYVRFEAFEGRVKRSGDTMIGPLTTKMTGWVWRTFIGDYDCKNPTTNDNRPMNLSVLDKNGLQMMNDFLQCTEASTRRIINTFYRDTSGNETKRCTLVMELPKDRDPYITAPTPTNSSSNSTAIATTAWVNRASSVVHTDGDEDIQGIKTFKNSIHIVNDLVSYIQSQNADTWTYLRGIEFRDKASERMGGIRSVRYTNTVGSLVNSTEIIARGRDNIDTLLAIVTADDGQKYAYCPSTPSNATNNLIATADWVIGKLAQKSKVTNVTSYTQLMDLIKNGKRGDSFGITMDYVGGSIGGIYATNKEVHAFGHYTIDEITVSDGALTGLQAFGSGEVSGKLKNDDDTTYTYATTGFGRQQIGTGVFDAFRVAEDGKLTYFVPNGESSNITAFEGYYISI